jgi:hypothetical protein
MVAVNQNCALVVKDLSTCPAMMFPAESCKRFTTMEAVPGIFISHPEFFIQELAA